MSSPYDLIETHVIRGNSFALTGKSIVEFGFGDLAPIIELHNNAPFRKYRGYEIMPATDVCFTPCSGIGPVVVNPSTVYDKYVGYSNHTKKVNILPEADFSSIFQLKFEHSIENFLDELVNGQKFDVAIFSNVFHKIRDRSIPHRMLDWFNCNSNPGAFLLVKVMTTEQYAHQGIDWIYSERELQELFEHFPGQALAKQCDEHFTSYLIQRQS